VIINLNNINEISSKTYSWLKINKLDIGETQIPEIVEYIDDIFESAKEDGYKILPYDEKINCHIEEKINKRKYGVSNELVNLAEKYSNSSYIINIEKGSIIEKPIVINYELSNQNQVLLDNIIIVSEESSSATVIINYKTSDDSIKGFHDGILKIYAKKHSNLKVIKCQNLNANSYNFDSNVAVLEESAKVKYIPIELGLGITAPNYISFLDGKESKSGLNSIYIGAKDSVIDLLYNMIQSGEKTVSNINSRGILLENSKKVFKGIIDLKNGCKKSKGEEEEKTVLLSPNAKSFAIPLLLCSEDDVSGSHSASSGRIDEKKLFYLMSRGFSSKEAKKIIIEGYFETILEEINCQKVKEEIKEIIDRRLD
jgi:FeS assembly protein SufD